MSSEGHYCDYDFGGSDYLTAAEEERYLDRIRKDIQDRIASAKLDFAEDRDRLIQEQQD